MSGPIPTGMPGTPGTSFDIELGDSTTAADTTETPRLSIELEPSATATARSTTSENTYTADQRLDATTEMDTNLQDVCDKNPSQYGTPITSKDTSTVAVLKKAIKRSHVKAHEIDIGCNIDDSPIRYPAHSGRGECLAFAAVWTVTVTNKKGASETIKKTQIIYTSIKADGSEESRNKAIDLANLYTKAVQVGVNPAHKELRNATSDTKKVFKNFQQSGVLQVQYAPIEDPNGITPTFSATPLSIGATGTSKRFSPNLLSSINSTAFGAFENLARDLSSTSRSIDPSRLSRATSDTSPKYHSIDNLDVSDALKNIWKDMYTVLNNPASSPDEIESIYNKFESKIEDYIIELEDLDIDDEDDDEEAIRQQEDAAQKIISELQKRKELLLQEFNNRLIELF